jgi:alcohol dehydrogenase
VAIVGAGPIGLAAIITARLYSPGMIIVIDLADSRLDAAKRLGADVVLNAAHTDAAAIRALTADGRGVDTAIEAVGVPSTFELCTKLVRPGGRVANAGVHGKPVTLHLEDLWIKDVTITTGLVDTSSTPMLLGLLAADRLPVGDLITHRFTLDEMPEAYEVFSDAGRTGALKVALFRG